MQRHRERQHHALARVDGARTQPGEVLSAEVGALVDLGIGEPALVDEGEQRVGERGVHVLEHVGERPARLAREAHRLEQAVLEAALLAAHRFGRRSRLRGRGGDACGRSGCGKRSVRRRHGRCRCRCAAKHVGIVGCDIGEPRLFTQPAPIRQPALIHIGIVDEAGQTAEKLLSQKGLAMSEQHQGDLHVGVVVREEITDGGHGYVHRHILGAAIDA